MNFSVIPQTRMTNLNGVMGYSMYFGLENLIKYNTRLYFYRYDMYDLVEIELTKDLMTIFIFPDCVDGIEKVILDEIDFFAGYFKTAGLEYKRFIFDVKNRMPVSYGDFYPVETIEDYALDRDILFILDKKNGGYITNRREVTCYKPIENCREMDNCILSLENDLINITKPKYLINYKTTNTVAILALISGFLSGISKSDIKEQLVSTDLSNKFLYPINKVEFSSNYVDSKMKDLNVDTFTQILTSTVQQGVEIIEKEFEGGEASVSSIMDIGLDKFIKMIKDQNKVVKVIVDTQWQDIISMYILKGCAFITPGAIKRLNHYRELFDSDNVQLVMN
jgi:hypothetical protein